MSWQTIRQPDGKLAVWSTIVDDFLGIDMTVDEVVEEYRKSDRRKGLEDSKGLKEMVESVAAGKPRKHDLIWEEAIELRVMCGHE